MANLLNDPNNWQDYSGTTPPAYWNGTNYGMSAGPGGNYLRMTLTASPSGADTIQGTVSGSGFSVQCYLNVVHGGLVVQSYILDGSQQQISLSAQSGMELIVTSSAGGTNPTTVYDGSLTIILPVPARCVQSKSRLFRGYATQYLSASQVQQLRVRRFQKRTLVVDFNGAIQPCDDIQEVRWDCTSPWATFISDPEISDDGKSVSLHVEFNFAGWGAIKATVTTDAGETLGYEFFFTIKDAPLYPSAQYNLANGPYFLIATA